MQRYMILGVGVQNFKRLSGHAGFMSFYLESCLQSDVISDSCSEAAAYHHLQGVLSDHL
jgi:hypothetical protein